MDSLYSFSAGFSYPLSSVSSGQNILSLLDPTLYQIASNFTKFLNQNLQPAFSSACSFCGITNANLSNWVDGYAVGQTVCFPLDQKIFQANSFRFPLLAIEPVNEEYSQFTLTNVATRREFAVSYILPPLTADQYNRLYPFFKQASQVLLGYGQQGYDPKISTNSFWHTAGVSFALFHGVNYEPFTIFDKGTDPSYYPGFTLHLEVQERIQLPIPANFPTSFSEVELKENLIDGYSAANPIDDLIDGYVYPNIAITSISPSSGTLQGNTLVSVFGHGFLNAVSISFAGSAARNLIVANDGLIIAQTAPGIGHTTYTGDVVITDTRGITHTLSNAFTYTQTIS